MTTAEFQALEPGQTIRHEKTGRKLIVTAQYGTHVVGQRGGETFGVLGFQAPHYELVEG